MTQAKRSARAKKAAHGVHQVALEAGESEEEKIECLIA